VQRMRPAPAVVEKTPRPLRMAVVYCRNPFPMRRADQITVAHLVEFLSARGHFVDIYCLDDGGQSDGADRLDDSDLAWLEARSGTLVHARQGRFRAILGTIRAILTGRPLQIGWLDSRRLAQALAKELAHSSYDVVYAYYVRSAEVVLRAKRIARGAAVPSVLAMQLSQTLNTRRISKEATNIGARLLFGLESRLLARYESRVWRSFDRTALIGPADVAAIEAECEQRRLPKINNWFYSPHGTDLSRFAPRAGFAPIPDTVLFAGTLWYPPNVQAVEWLAHAIWPLVRKEIPNAELLVVGRDPLPEVQALASQSLGVQVIGSVPDLSEYMLRAAVCVNPVRAAGGMQNKLLEYLASGRPVVATRVANEGIAAPDDVLILADDAEEFAASIVWMLRNRAEAESIGRRARQYAEAGWSWEAHFLELESNLLALVQHVGEGREDADA